MANPLNMLPHAVGQHQQAIIYGEVSAHQPAPASFTDPLFVVQPDWSRDFYWTVHNWPAIHGGTLPAHGAEVMLVKDPRDNLRCIWWDGAFTPYFPITDPD